MFDERHWNIVQRLIIPLDGSSGSVMLRGMNADRWIITAMAILLAATIALCFAYKAKLSEASEYVEFMEGVHKDMTAEHVKHMESHK